MIVEVPLAPLLALGVKLLVVEVPCVWAFLTHERWAELLTELLTPELWVELLAWLWALTKSMNSLLR